MLYIIAYSSDQGRAQNLISKIVLIFIEYEKVV